MNSDWKDWQALLDQWHREKRHPNEMALELANKGLDIQRVETLIKRYKVKLSQREGLKWLLGGALLLVFGAIITVYLFHQNVAFDVLMYTSTITGIGMGIYGLYKILG